MDPSTYHWYWEETLLTLVSLWPELQDRNHISPNPPYPYSSQMAMADRFCLGYIHRDSRRDSDTIHVFLRKHDSLKLQRLGRGYAIHCATHSTTHSPDRRNSLRAASQPTLRERYQIFGVAVVLRNLDSKYVICGANYSLNVRLTPPSSLRSAWFIPGNQA